MKFGLKLWSTNIHYVEEAKKLYKENVYSYIELFAVPHSYEKYISHWKELDIPFIIHAPHYTTGLNFADSSKKKSNLKLAKEAFRFANSLSAKQIIFHPGVEGNLSETIAQIQMIFDERILIENKPYFGFSKTKKRILCRGYNPFEIESIQKACGVGFCLDFPHAIYAANAQEKNIYQYIEEFLKLNPIMFHIADGDSKGVCDQHQNIGYGTINFAKFFYLLESKNKLMTIETKKNSTSNLNDFSLDIERLQCFLK
jgi:deoxyribonuclease IV